MYIMKPDVDIFVIFNRFIPTERQLKAEVHLKESSLVS